MLIGLKPLRNLEIEADLLAASLLGIDNYICLLHEIKAREGILRFLPFTHPITNKRIATVRKQQTVR